MKKRLKNKRFTEQGVFEKGKEFLIGKKYWDFLGGDNTFDNLLELFDSVGKNFKENIQQKIKQVAKEKIEGI
ncbi:MAG: TdeIII family type II restriction endonuclease [Leptospiraceae bacterium]|nr:TdeIII family type II restriction endonuclease [Leptospiraceae bacterium]